MPTQFIQVWNAINMDILCVRALTLLLLVWTKVTGAIHTMSQFFTALLLIGLPQQTPPDAQTSFFESLLDYLVPGIAILLLMGALVLAAMQIMEMTNRK